MGDTTGAAVLPAVVLTSVVPVPGTSNVRDLGGYPVGDRRVLRTGRLYRGEALVRPGPGVGHVALWNDDFVTDYRALALSTVIDLRGSLEAASAPSAWGDATAARVLHIAIEEGGDADATDYVRQLRGGTLREFSSDDLADYYSETIRSSAPALGAAIRAIAEDDATPVLVHCASGKDRTGMLVALVLEALGTPREVVVADYALTGHLRPDRVGDYAEVLDEHGIERESVRALFETPPEAMRLLLQGIDAEFGSVVDFLLTSGGVDAETIVRLRNVLTEPEA